eukprot:scaffold28626_cov58-Attheya_sp.AAC.2
MRRLVPFLLLTSALAAPSPCPTDQSIIGYSDWATLKADVTNYANGNTYVVCPDSYFTLSYEPNNPGLYIRHFRDNPQLNIWCANTNCVVDGGHHHIWFNQVGVANIKGFTFLNSDRGSTFLGTGNGPVTFEDCIWRGNSGYNINADIDPVCFFYGCAGAIGGQYSSVVLRQCQILDNSGYTGAVFCQGGDITLDHCLFDNNKSTWSYFYGQPTGSALTMWDGSGLSTSYSCFQNNDSAGVGTVKTTEIVDKLYLNDNNMFEGNIVKLANVDTGTMCPNSIYVLDWNDIDECVPGDGTTCPTYNDPCDSDPYPCANNETCVDIGNDNFKCEDFVDNPCNPNPCTNGMECVNNGNGDYECEEDPCDPNPCPSDSYNCTSLADGIIVCTPNENDSDNAANYSSEMSWAVIMLLCSSSLLALA